MGPYLGVSDGRQTRSTEVVTGHGGCSGPSKPGGKTDRSAFIDCMPQRYLPAGCTRALIIDLMHAPRIAVAGR